MLCEYGCGQEAQYQFKNGKWCCEKSKNSCPYQKKINSEKNKNKRLGRIPWNKGKTGIYSDETINKLRIANIGKTLSDETKLKIGKASKGNNYCKGRKLSKTHIEKIKKANSGKNNGMYGKKHSTETRKKIKKVLMTPTVNRKIVNANKGKVSKLKLKLKDFKKKNPLLFEIEELKEKNGKIFGHCKNHNCPNSKEQGGWFEISNTQLFNRINSILYFDGSYFYCCEECKQKCPLFNLQSDPNKTSEVIYSYTEYQTFRNEVLKRANNKCEYCGEKATHVHHSRPQKLEPFYSVDPDFGIACCEKCHYKHGHKDECSTGQLANKVCI